MSSEVAAPAVSAAGLTGEEAARRRPPGGNRLPVEGPPSPVRLLVAQLVHFFALLLWAAAALAFVGGMPQLAVAIVVVVVLNGLFAFVQEYRADRAAQALRDLVPHRVTVVRDGRRQEIDAVDLVVGDLVLPEAGDRVAADLRVLDAHGLRLDEAMLTGESEPVGKGRDDAVYAGCFVVEGEASAVVTAVAGDTRLASIATLTRGVERAKTPLAKELDRLVRTITVLALGIGAVCFAAGVVLGLPLSDGFLFAVGVTVALVPEGLLPTVTLSLARGAQLLAARKGLVRRLESVETLGSTTFICTDKTGTLTQNRMAVVTVWTPQGRISVHGTGYEPTAELEGPEPALAAARELARTAARCSTGRTRQDDDGSWIALGDPMEAALDALAHRLGVPGTVEGSPPGTRRFPFDPRRRRMSVWEHDVLSVKGAPGSVLDRCTDPGPAAEEADRLAARGLRVLAVARRRGPLPDGADADTAEQDLELLGLVGLEDPPRPHVGAALASCRTAGIGVAMITGDSAATAEAIARETGLWLPTSRVLRGDELPADEAALGELLADGVVVCRVAPEDKLRIARALQARGHVVAMTGDGVNDGPALRAADIGVAMGVGGTDVARQAADLVLLDDDFATIVAAVRQGRTTFANIRRFLTYHLTDNVAELTPFVVFTVTGGGVPLALSVLQVLSLDIATDLLPALALGAEPSSPRVLDGPPPRRRLVDAGLLRRALTVLGPVEATVAMGAFLTVLLGAGWSYGEPVPAGTLAGASGAAFTAVVLGQFANAFACRSTSRPAWRLGWRSNPLLVWAVAVELVVLLALLLVPLLADLLGQSAPPLPGLLVALAAVPAVLLADAAAKRVAVRRRAGGQRTPAQSARSRA